MGAFAILAEVSRLCRCGAGVRRSPRLTEWGSLAVSNVEDSCAEMARAGRRFVGANTLVANAVASVTAIVTTTAPIALFNSEPDGGRNIYLDRVGFMQTNAFASSSMTMMMCLSGKRILDLNRPASMATGYGIASTNGLGKSSALWTPALTLDASTVWFQVASLKLPVPSATAANHQFLGHTPTRLEGGLIIPPGYAAGFALLHQSVSVNFSIFAHWNELENTLDVA